MDLGLLVQTIGVTTVIEKDPTIGVSLLLKRHEAGDWGDISEHDASLNRRHVKEGEGGIMSVYKDCGEDGITLWIITEWDHSVTTILLPSEY